MRAFSVSALVTIGLFASAGAAVAASNCSITATPVAFGSYDPFSPVATDSLGTISYRCTGMGNSGSVTIDLGPGWWGSVSQRRMAQPYWLGLEFLPYNLYLDPARTEIWGDGSTGQEYGPVQPPNGKSVDVTVYGRIPPQQDVSAGNYFDFVTVTINF